MDASREQVDEAIRKVTGDQAWLYSYDPPSVSVTNGQTVVGIALDGLTQSAVVTALTPVAEILGLDALPPPRKKRQTRPATPDPATGFQETGSVETEASDGVEPETDGEGYG